jgi:hypothetical protein
MNEFIGNNPLDRASWPEKLTAKVIEPGVHPRLCGYDLQQDLAKHYRWSEVAFLSLTGELPSEEIAEALDIALIFLSAVSVNEAPGHAAVLAGFCGTINSASIGVVAITLAEQARTTVERYLKNKTDVASNPNKNAGAQELQKRLAEKGLSFELNTHDEVFAALSLLEQCGLSTPSQLEAAWVMTRLPVALAESWQQPASQFAKYPTQLPAFQYKR